MILACAAALGLAVSAGLTGAASAAAVSPHRPAAARQAPLVVRTADGSIRGLYRGSAR
jgi:hypothetical protein